MEEHTKSSSSVKNVSEDVPHVPDCDIMPSPQRPDPEADPAWVPVIDMAHLRHSPHARSLVVEEIGKACQQMGFFQVINHGICPSIAKDALSSAIDFFELPIKEKIGFMSDDVSKPVRFSTSIKDGEDRIQFWRVFLKHYAHPLDEWVKLWPSNPPDYRKKMGRYCTEVRKLGLEVMGAIMESLGLGPKYLSNKLEEGMQVMAINCYPPCPHPDLVLGLPPHSDFSCITIVLQSCQGLQVLGPDGDTWRAVPELPGSLQVHVGDHLEVLSNGRYKSVQHQATLNAERTRISIASLHCLVIDEKMRPADELVNDPRPRFYKESSFRDFLNFIATNDIADGSSFLDTLKIDC